MEVMWLWSSSGKSRDREAVGCELNHAACATPTRVRQQQHKTAVKQCRTKFGSSVRGGRGEGLKRLNLPDEHLRAAVEAKKNPESSVSWA